MSCGQNTRTQSGGGQQRTITSNEQHSVISAPVAGSRQVMQQTTTVFPLGKKLPETCVQLVPTTSLQGSITRGGWKNTTPPSEPWHWTDTSVGQMICGRHWSVVFGGQLV